MRAANARSGLVSVPPTDFMPPALPPGPPEGLVVPPALRRDISRTLSIESTGIVHAPLEIDALLRRVSDARIRVTLADVQDYLADQLLSRTPGAGSHSLAAEMAALIGGGSEGGEDDEAYLAVPPVEPPPLATAAFGVGSVAGGMMSSEMWDGGDPVHLGASEADPGVAANAPPALEEGGGGTGAGTAVVLAAAGSDAASDAGPALDEESGAELAALASAAAIADAEPVAGASKRKKRVPGGKKAVHAHANATGADEEGGAGEASLLPADDAVAAAPAAPPAVPGGGSRGGRGTGRGKAKGAAAAPVAEAEADTGEGPPLAPDAVAGTKRRRGPAASAAVAAPPPPPSAHAADTNTVAGGDSRAFPPTPTLPPAPAPLSAQRASALVVSLRRAATPLGPHPRMRALLHWALARAGFLKAMGSGSKQ